MAAAWPMGSLAKNSFIAITAVELDRFQSGCNMVVGFDVLRSVLPKLFHLSPVVHDASETNTGASAVDLSKWAVGELLPQTVGHCAIQTVDPAKLRMACYERV